MSLNLYSLFYKSYLTLEKYINKLFYFDIFDSILKKEIRVNYRLFFDFIKNKNKKFYIYFDIYKNKVFNIFKSFKTNVKSNNNIIKYIYNNEDIIIKNKVFNDYKYDYKID